MQNVSQDDILNLPLSLPSLDDQRMRTQIVEEQTTRIDATIRKVQRFIELAKERRSALITAAVTGQINVRDQAAHSTDQPSSAADLEGLAI